MVAGDLTLASPSCGGGTLVPLLCLCVALLGSLVMLVCVCLGLLGLALAFLLACWFGFCLLCWCLAGVLLPVLLALLVLVVPAVLSALLVLLVLVRSRLFSGVFRCPPVVARFFM